MMYPDTHYSRTLAESRRRPVLSTAMVCDTAIVGGGLAGLMTALPLARAGQRVIVLEAKSVGFGASGRNGGFVSPGYSADGEAIARMAGVETARALHRMSIEGVDCLRDTVTALDIPGVRLTGGITSVLRYDDGASLVAHAAAMRREFGYELDYLDSGAIRTALKTRRYFHALRDQRAFHLHPLNYLRGVALEIERLGGRIYENSPALQTDVYGPKQKILTAGGEVVAQNLVLATGGYTGSLNASLQRSFLPIATYVMVSKAAPELIASAMTTTDGIADNRRAGDYYRSIENGRCLLWGGRIATRTADTAGIVKALRREMQGTYPQLQALKTELAWSGLMSYARHRMPQIGKLQPGVWYCTAFGGHGLNTTAIGGKVIAEGILEQSERYQIFRPFGLLWAGGRAGLAVAQLAYWKLQARDWWRERAV